METKNPVSTPAERIEELLSLVQEVDLPTLRMLDRKLHVLLEEKGIDHLGTEQEPSAREEFCRQHPHVKIDPDLFALVGIHPESPVEDDKTLIREQIAGRLSGEASR